MAIDTTLWAAQVPAGTYAVGDKIQMTNIRGPAVVRDGFGAALFKKVYALADISVLNGMFKVVVKNSNWIDSLSSPAISPSGAETALAKDSSAVQNGQDLPLIPNSGWNIYAECILAGTTTQAGDVFALIDIDFPRVLAVEDPYKVAGYPITIDGSYTITSTAAGSALSMVWNTFNVDIFKAGYKYLLSQSGFYAANTVLGFMSISGAAGQSGLERIVPVRSSTYAGMKYPMDYATPLVKGPMNLNFAAIGTGTSLYEYMDFVKKNI